MRPCREKNVNVLHVKHSNINLKNDFIYDVYLKRWEINSKQSKYRYMVFIDLPHKRIVSISIDKNYNVHQYKYVCL